MKIRKNKKLNPQLWDKDNCLKKAVSDIVILIAQSYIDSIRKIQQVNIEKSDVKDIFLYGSSANYFYTKKSDIDICIVIDFDSVMAKNPGKIINPHEFKLYYYNWAMTHRARIYGRKTDVSIQDINQYFYGDRYRSGPAFSVLKNKWIFEPVFVSDAEFRLIQKQARQVYKKIMHDYRTVKRNGFLMEDVKKLYSDIYLSKNTTHQKNVAQPVTYMYIAFRKIRDRGIIDKLRDRMVELESKNFVLQ